MIEKKLLIISCSLLLKNRLRYIEDYEIYVKDSFHIFQIYERIFYHYLPKSMNSAFS